MYLRNKYAIRYKNPPHPIDRYQEEKIKNPIFGKRQKITLKNNENTVSLNLQPKEKILEW